MLSSILQLLDAELDRLKRLREIVADLGKPSANLVNSVGVAAFLEEPVSPLAEPSEAARADAEASAQTTPTIPQSSEPAAKRRRRSAKEVKATEDAELVEPVELGTPVEPGAGVAGSGLDPVERKVEAKGEKASSPESVASVADDSRTSSKRAPRPGEIHVVKEPKPSMVVVSATEAARERASRLARLPVKRAAGEHPGPKPDAAPEDLARDLAARWLSGAGSGAELLDR